MTRSHNRDGRPRRNDHLSHLLQVCCQPSFQNLPLYGTQAVNPCAVVGIHRHELFQTYPGRCRDMPVGCPCGYSNHPGNTADSEDNEYLAFDGVTPFRGLDVHGESRSALVVAAQSLGSLQQALTSGNGQMVRLNEVHGPFSRERIVQGLLEGAAYSRD